MAAHAISVMGIAEGDGEFERLAVTSRELMQVERSYKGFSAQSFFQTVTMENLYRVAFVVLKMRGRLDAKAKFDEFIEAWSVSPTDPAEIARRFALARAMAEQGAGVDEIQAAVLADMSEPKPEGPDGETVGVEVDPTHPTA